MLVTGDKELSESSVTSSGVGSNDTPPPYEPTVTLSISGEPAAGPSATFLPPHTNRPQNVLPTNLAKIKRTNNSIKGTFVIDPGLIVPEELLLTSDPAREEEDALPAGPRKNLQLTSVNGSITADIWLVDEEAESGRDVQLDRAELEVGSNNGSVTVKLHSTTTRPFSLTISSKNGTVNVSLPKDFVGPVVLSTVNGSTSLSKPVNAQLVTFSEEYGTRKCFLGDYRSAGYTSRQQWTGSTVDISTNNGATKLSFVDEVAENNSKGGFWRKFWDSV